MSEALWTANEAARATGGRATGDWRATGVSIDTRSLQSGDLFVALSAARDGHEFVAQALDKGAAAALVSRVPDGIAPDAPLLLVDDVLDALGQLGAAARARTSARVIVVTGSVGKTTTKEMLRAALTGQGRIHAAEASYNNHWGVPLTLARMPAETDFAIVEIGMNHPGEIAPLSRLARPHVALITTVAPAHLEAFDSIAGIAAEKMAICDGLEPDGIAILPTDLAPEAKDVVDAGAARRKALRFGGDTALPWHIADLRPAEGALVLMAASPHGQVPVALQAPGRHLALNALGALAAATAAGADLALSAQGLGRWQPPVGRGRRETVMLDPQTGSALTLIDDAFNANPASMAAALDVLISSTPGRGGRRVAFLGDMLELGDDATALHAAIADHPGLDRIDIIHGAGPLIKHTLDALPAPQRGQWLATADEMTQRIRDLVGDGDIVLVKGSKGAKTARIVDAIRNLGHPARETI